MQRYLSPVIFVVAVLSLFYIVDFMAVWEVEMPLGLSALELVAHRGWGIDGVSFLPKVITAGSLATIGETELGLRFPSMVLWALSLFVFYKWGNPIFSPRTTLLGVMLAAVSFPILWAAKIGVADMWLLFFQIVVFLAVVYHLKKPQTVHIPVILLGCLGMSLVQPLSAFVFSLALFSIFPIAHKKGKNIVKAGAASVALTGLLPFLSGMNELQTGFLWSYNTSAWQYIMATFLGTLTVLGMLPVVLYHLFKRFSMKEELSILMGGALLAGCLSMSLFAHFILLFLVGKQMDLYHEKNYPYRNAVIVGTVAQVVICFFVAILLIMNAFDWLGATGFRKTILFGVPVWILGIYNLLALYSDNKIHLRNSILLGAAACNFLYWTQVMPLWESRRNVVKKIAVHPALESATEIYWEASIGKATFPFYAGTILKHKNVRLGGMPDNPGHTAVLISDDVNISPPFRDSIQVQTLPWEEAYFLRIK